MLDIEARNQVGYRSNPPIRTSHTHMKSTLLFICSLLCLAFFSWQLVQTGQPIEPSKDAYEQVMDAKAAELLLKDQQGFNWIVGMLNLVMASVATVVAFCSLFLLRKPALLHWLRLGLFFANILIVISCAILFGVTLVETMQPTPRCLGPVWPWTSSFWEHAIKHVQQAGMFLGLCCGMLGGVNCAAFYYARARRRMYNGE